MLSRSLSLSLALSSQLRAWMTLSGQNEFSWLSVVYSFGCVSGNDLYGNAHKSCFCCNLLLNLFSRIGQEQNKINKASIRFEALRFVSFVKFVNATTWNRIENFTMAQVEGRANETEASLTKISKKTNQLARLDSEKTNCLKLQNKSCEFTQCTSIIV